MKVWRNLEGREFPVNENGDGQLPNNRWLPSWDMKHLGYELVEKDPEEFELECIVWKLGIPDYSLKILRDDRLIPGKTYLVREKV